MSLTLGTLFIAVLGSFSLCSIMKDLGTSEATGGRMTIGRSKNAGGFYFITPRKSGFVCFAIAVILHGFGVIVDPAVWLAQTFPFLAHM